MVLARQFDRMKAEKFDDRLKGRATDQPELGDAKDERKEGLMLCFFLYDTRHLTD